MLNSIEEPFIHFLKPYLSLSREHSFASREILLHHAEEFMGGILAYKTHPNRRPPNAQQRVAWERGSTRLLTFGTYPATSTPILLIPSLINRAYILDLLPDHSIVGFLRGQNYAPFLLDWGEPGLAEVGFSLTDYFTHRLLPALLALKTWHRALPHILGYCMGGIFALRAAQEVAVRSIILIATPWEFTWVPQVQALTLETMAEQLLDTNDFLPGSFLQILFSTLHLEHIWGKFISFSKIQDQEKKLFFVAVEDWVNDNVSLAKEVARDIFQNWLVKNGLANQTWWFQGAPPLGNDFQTPTLICLGSRDRIVPCNCALPLAKVLKNAESYIFDVGHTGLVIGQQAKTKVWPLIQSWLR